MTLPEPTREPIPANYVDAALRAYYDAAGVHWDTLAASDQQAATACMTAALEAFVAVAAPDMIQAAVFHASRQAGTVDLVGALGAAIGLARQDRRNGGSHE